MPEIQTFGNENSKNTWQSQIQQSELNYISIYIRADPQAIPDVRD